MTDEKIVINTRISEGIKKRLEEIALDRDMSLSGLFREILIEVIKPKNKYAFLEDGCTLREYLSIDEVPIGKQYSEGFYCLKKAPSLTRLGSGIESAASKICAKCIIREGALEDSKILREQRKKGIKIKMPHCTRGGIPNEGLSEFYCPKIGKNRPITEEREKQHKPCRLAGANNSNCFDLKFRTVISGLKEKDNR